MRVGIARFDRYFQAVFGVSRLDYWLGPLAGFDIVRFDEEVLCSGERPVSEVIRERAQMVYAGQRGEELVEYIRRLL